MNMETAPAKKRYLSLDVLRGLTIAFMCVVNNPGSWSHIFPPLRHAAWTGCTPTDLVYPFFLFCSGCAMAFSFAKYYGHPSQAMGKIFRRGLAIILVGILINLFPFFPVSPHDPTWTFGQNYAYWLGHRRIFGVLQRIGVSYIIGGVLAVWLKKPARIMGAIAVLATAYTLILVLFGSAPGPFTLEGNVSMKIDLALVGPDHVYHGYHLPDGSPTNFDPEGLLGGMTGACTLLLGYLIGSMIRRSGKRLEKDPSDGSNQPVVVSCRIFVYACFSLALAMILSIWIPISKPLWSASYVFYAGGWSMMALALLAYLIDVRGHSKLFQPFNIMGHNALAAFVLSDVIVVSARDLGFYSTGFYHMFTLNEYTSLAWALIFGFVIFLLLWFLYSKKIFIRL